MRKDFIGPEAMNAAIQTARAVAAANGVEIALAGGVAMQYYGSPRLTKDVDFLASGPLATTTPLIPQRPIGFGGTVYRDPNGTKVDWIVRSDDYQGLYEAALAGAVAPEPGATKVLTPEYMAALKLAAGRATDVEDLKWLLKAPGLLVLQNAKNLVYKYVGGQFAVEAFMRLEDQAELEQRWEERRGE